MTEQDDVAVMDPSSYDELLRPLLWRLKDIKAAETSEERCDSAGALVSALEPLVKEAIKVRDDAAREILTREPKTHTQTAVARLMHVTKGGLQQKMVRWGVAGSRG